jgi:hypothetical protein
MASLIVQFAYDKDTCQDDIGLCAQNIDIIIGQWLT